MFPKLDFLFNVALVACIGFMALYLSNQLFKLLGL